MQATRQARTAHIRLATLEVSTLTRGEVSVDLAEVSERYGADVEYAKRASDVVAANDPFAFAAAAFPLAKRILHKDGYHGPGVFLFLPSGEVRSIVIDFEDQVDKYTKWEAIAAEVERAGATGLVFIAEAWTAPDQGKDMGTPPSQRKDRGEVLTATAASADGRLETRAATFKRDESGRVVFTGESVFKNEVANWLEPVRRVWRHRSTTSREPPPGTRTTSTD